MSKHFPLRSWHSPRRRILCSRSSTVLPVPQLFRISLYSVPPQLVETSHLLVLFKVGPLLHNRAAFMFTEPPVSPNHTPQVLWPFTKVVIFSCHVQTLIICPSSLTPQLIVTNRFHWYGKIRSITNTITCCFSVKGVFLFRVLFKLPRTFRIIIPSAPP